MDDRTFILSLPSEITVDILSRLPLPTILSCKCVCKKWFDLISSFDFAEHHFAAIGNASSSTGLALYKTYTEQSSCRIFEFEDDVSDLPSRDLHYKKLIEFDPKSSITHPKALVFIVGSVDGLLCFQASRSNVDAYHICNPLRREYISLPDFTETGEYPNIIAHGFGVSSSSGQYKLVRINHDSDYEGFIRISNPLCILYTLGTGSWRKIGSDGGSYEYTHSSAGAFFNGCLHWLVSDEMNSQLISRFDLETETFKPLSTPFSGLPYSRSVAILDDRLCYCDNVSEEEMVIWVMTEYGVEGSWTKEIVIPKCDPFDLISSQMFFPFKVFKDGDVLVFVENFGLYRYSPEEETASELEMCCDEAVLHISSFLPLKKFVLEDVRTF